VTVRARPSRPAQAPIRLAVRAHGGVTVESYAYSAGVVEPLAPHFHTTWQLTWSPDSLGEHWMRGGLCEVPPRALGVIPPGEVHETSRRTWLPAPELFMTAYLDDSFVAGLATELAGRQSGTPSFGAGVIAGDRTLSRLFARAHESSFAGEPLERDDAWLALVTHLLARHGRLPSRPRSRREPRAVAAALAVLHGRPHERITLDDLARAADITPTRLCRAFAHQLGLPPHAYQLRLRIEDAKRQLRQGRAVADVAASTGFADQSHFGRHFRRIVGSTPSRYRRAALGRDATISF
jgi:AraC-like DNA-binding protein